MDLDKLIKTTKEKVLKHQQYSKKKPFSKSVINAVITLSNEAKMNGSEIAKAIGVSQSVACRFIRKSKLKKSINIEPIVKKEEAPIQLFDISDEIHSFVKKDIQETLTMRFKTSNGITIELFS